MWLNLMFLGSSLSQLQLKGLLVFESVQNWDKSFMPPFHELCSVLWICNLTALKNYVTILFLFEWGILTINEISLFFEWSIFPPSLSPSPFKRYLKIFQDPWLATAREPKPLRFAALDMLAFFGKPNLTWYKRLPDKRLSSRFQLSCFGVIFYKSGLRGNFLKVVSQLKPGSCMTWKKSLFR